MIKQDNMNQKTLQNIIALTEKRIPLLRNREDGEFYRWSQTFLDGIEDEIEEVKEELQSGRKVFLEDELGDVFWDYVCLLENLELEGKIEKSQVFERCWKKFSERLNADGSNNGDWYAVKKKQKEELQKEQENYKNWYNA